MASHPSYLWERIDSYLNAQVFSLMSDARIGRKWLADLYSCSEGIRLAICLAIDIHHSALDCQTIAEILDRVNPAHPDARSEFANAIGKHPKGRLFDCGVCYDFTDILKPRYVRVVDLWEFIDYYAGPTYHYTLSVDDEMTVYGAFLEDLAHLRLGDIKVEWTGGHGRAWVIPEDELLKRTSALDGDTAATYVNDFLGLGRRPRLTHGRNAELLAVRYPVGFDPGCRRPVVLDASWKNPGGFYVSSATRDGWGMTQSCSGTAQPCSERVHPGFLGLSDDFSLSRIGCIERLTEDRRALLAEAYSRCPLE